MGIQIPQLQIQTTPTVINIVETDAQMTLTGAVMDASLVVDPSPEANMAGISNGVRTNFLGKVSVESTKPDVAVEVLQKGDISYSVTGVRVDYLAG